jgi:urease accessory protein
MSLATLLVLADGRLPAGGHAHSGGLEAAVEAGRVADLRSLNGFLRGRLATSGLVAAAFAAAACRRATDFPGAANFPRTAAFPQTADLPNVAASPSAATSPSATGPSATTCPKTDIPALDQGLDARTPSPALRAASRAQGRALMRAARAMWPVPNIGREPHHPIALGVTAAAAGLTPRDAATAAAYGSLTGPATAAVRLLGLDPYGTHALLAALATDCDQIAAEAATHALDDVDDLPAGGAPRLDLGAEYHSTWEVRLFAS